MPTNTKKKRVNNNPRPYPFRSKASILESVRTDDSACVEALSILYQRQTDTEQDKGQTQVRNRAGFMSSHAVRGTALARKQASEGLTPDELAEARTIVLRYGKQLAAHYRKQVIEQDANLSELAKLFSAN